MKQVKERALAHAKVLVGIRKIRFVLTGIANTLVDFLFFNIFILVFSIGVAPANILSVSITICVSYLLNKEAVFRNKQPHSARQIALFLGVTLSGIAIQTLLVVQVLGVLKNIFDPAAQSTVLWVLQNLAKVSGIFFSVVWNYSGYSRIVFRENKAGRA